MPVGAGLPAMAVCHSTEMLKLMASSLASQLPRGHQGSQNRSSPEIKTVGASLLAKAVCQSRRMLTLTTPSRAGSLPHVFASDITFAHAANHCGRGLARDGGVSFDRDVEADGLIAGKPAPTGSSGFTKSKFTRDQNCGSEPARESGVSVEKDVDADDPFASRLAPTCFRVGHNFCTRRQPLWERACPRWRCVIRQRC